MHHHSLFQRLFVCSLGLLALIFAATLPVLARSSMATSRPPATITEYPLPSAKSTPGGLVVGADRAIWFAESDGNQIGRIDLNGKITEYPIPTAQSNLSHQAFVARGADGAVWFTESRANKLGRITAARHITEYPIPTAPTMQDPALGSITTSFPIALVAGPDDAIWFNETFGNKIGRLRNGTFTEFPLPITLNGPVGLIVGADAALWFTTKANAIGRMTTAGQITQYPIPTPKSGLLRLALGPDGAIWFCEAFADKIGRITTAGTITEFALPAGTAPVSLVFGPDGALWFTGFKSNAIGRLTTAGAVATYPVPTAQSAPYHIVLGTDQALWFTEIDGNKIGRLALDPLATPSPPGGIALPNAGGSDNLPVLVLGASVALLVVLAGVTLGRRTH